MRDSQAWLSGCGFHWKWQG